MTNIQAAIEWQRVEYGALPRPLLSFLAKLHGLTVRDFAEIFKISKSHAESLLNHKTFPSLELAVRISRYFECSTDELFAWRLDDDGSRRTLLVEIPGTGKHIRLNDMNPSHEALGMVAVILESLKTGASLLDHDWEKRG